MKLSNLEVFLLIIQVILLPGIHIFFNSIRKDILNICKEIILEHYTALDNLIDANRARIEDFKLHSVHREELLKIHLKQLSSRILEIELYLAKNGYALRHHDDDSDISGFLNTTK